MGIKENALYNVMGNLVENMLPASNNWFKVIIEKFLNKVLGFVNLLEDIFQLSSFLVTNTKINLLKLFYWF